MRTSALLGFFAVLIGAFGAHALRDHLDERGIEIFQTAWNYHAFHSVALLSFAWGSADGRTERAIERTRILFLFGTLLFSGSLYLLAITKLSWLGAITPIGGTLFLLGWGNLVYGTKKRG
ncbi:DUF423 domain-containing protein [bacterium]|nr:DUF423 domain-containing protein [bacterium]